jgi:putative flippase GtrA
MTFAPSQIVTAASRIYRTTVGKRFSRFVLVAVAALAASQLMLTLLIGVVGVSPGISGTISAVAGALVSYILSRWAWERKGRPDLLRETLPFWLVSVGAWIVLGLASHYASVWANAMNLEHWERVVFIDIAYFVANCLTFVTRFLIFHYVLFADRGSKVPPSPATEPLSGDDDEPSANGSDPFGSNGSAARVNGTAWAGEPAGRSLPGTPVAEPGARR